MLAKVISCALVGLEGALVEVEVDIAPGLPNFFVVGLPDDAVREARERARSAVRNSGFTFPMRRVVVNLAPADLKKEGPAYDLPIAVAILLASEQLEADVSKTLFLGELSLYGTLRHTSGILPMVALASQLGLENVIVPETDATEAALVGGVRIIPLSSLSQVAAFLRGEISPEAPVVVIDENPIPEYASVDLAHIRAGACQTRAGGGGRRRSQPVMTGLPGTGKTLASGPSHRYCRP